MFAFTLPSLLPDYQVEEREYSWAKRLACLIFGTGLNMILVAAMAPSSEEIQSPIKWFAISEMSLLLYILKRPAGVAIEAKAAKSRSLGRYAWMQAAIIGSTDQLLSMMILLTSFLTLVSMFPLNYYHNYIKAPWPFFIFYFTLIGTIFAGMEFVGAIIVNLALYEYGKPRVDDQLRLTLAEATSLILMLKSIFHKEEESYTELLKTKQRLLRWASPRWKYIIRGRIQKAARLTSMMDLELLARKSWGLFKEVLEQDPALQWQEFADSILVLPERRPRPKLSLLDESITDVGILQEQMERIRKRTIQLSDQISEHENLFGQLRLCLSITWAIITFIVVFPLLGFSPNLYLIPLGVSITPTLIALTVIFGTSISTIIESIIFTFYRHPFDVGDELSIDGTYFQVKRVGLLACIFENASGIRTYYPTASLLTKNIINTSRSRPKRQQIRLTFNKVTTSDTVNQISDNINETIASQKGLRPMINVHEHNEGMGWNMLVLIDYLEADNDPARQSIQGQRVLMSILEILQAQQVQSTNPLISLIQL